MVHSYTSIGSADDRSAVHDSYRNSIMPLLNVEPHFIPKDPFASIHRLPTLAGSPLSLSSPQGFDPFGSLLSDPHREPASTSQHLRPPTTEWGDDDDDAAESISFWDRLDRLRNKLTGNEIVARERGIHPYDDFYAL